MRENVAVEWINASGRGPGVEGEIVGATWNNGKDIKLLCLWQGVPIFRHEVKEAAMKMHRMNHDRIIAKHT